jgi:hypothetical protein
MLEPKTDIEKQRAVWWAEHCKPGMSLEQVWRLNNEVMTLFPMTPEEREEWAHSHDGIPEFAL